MTNRRKVSISKNRMMMNGTVGVGVGIGGTGSVGNSMNERMSLLRDGGGTLQDPHISSLYPHHSSGSGSGNGSANANGNGSMDSFEAELNEAASTVQMEYDRGAAVVTVTPPSNRFTPQHSPRGVPVEDQEEMNPSNGALQFMPAYERSNNTVGPPRRQHSYNDQDTAWDSLMDDGASNNNNITAAGTSRFRRKAKSMVGVGQQGGYHNYNASSFHMLSREKEKQTPPADAGSESVVSANNAQRKGSRIQRLASIFSNRATIKAGGHATRMPLEDDHAPHDGYNNNDNDRAAPQQIIQQPQSLSPPRPMEADAPVQPVSPSQSSSSAGYLGWPGTIQDKRGETVAILPSCDESSIGTNTPTNTSAALRRRQFAERSSSSLSSYQHSDPKYEEDKKWMETNPAFNDLSSVLSKTPSPLVVHHHQPPSSKDTYLSGDTKLNDSMDSQQSPHEQNPADFHLAAVVADARLAANSPLRKETMGHPMDHPATLVPPNSQGRSNSRGRSVNNINIKFVSPDHTITTAKKTSSSSSSSLRHGSIHQEEKQQHYGDYDIPNRSSWRTSANVQPLSHNNDNNTASNNNNNNPWDMDACTTQSTLSAAGTTVSKTSSAFLNESEINGMTIRNRVNQRLAAATAVMRPKSGAAEQLNHQPPTEDALARNNQLLSAPPRAFGNARGYRGLLDKTRDVPNLIDDSDTSVASSTANHHNSSTAPATYRSQGPNLHTHREGVVESPSNTNTTKDAESDVFDEISKYSLSDKNSDCYDDLPNVTSGETHSSNAVNMMAKTTNNNNEDNNNNKNNMNSCQNSNMSLTDFCGVGVGNTNDDATNAEGGGNNNGLKLVLLGGGLTTIQTTSTDFSNRKTASDYDENLTNSDIDQYGFCRIPGFNEMASAGRKPHDSSLEEIDPVISDEILSQQNSREHNDSDLAADPTALRQQQSQRTPNTSGFGFFGNHSRYSLSAAAADDSGGTTTNSSSGSSHYGDDESAFFSDFYAWEEGANSRSYTAGDLSRYYVQPSDVKQLVRRYRKLCRSQAATGLSYEEFEKHEDDKKVFALFEMRSRVMEKDIERGLERRGGTVTVDDIVITPYHKMGLRIRDAVIVSKAWRDGASPMDVINTALLTQREYRPHFIRRPPTNRGGGNNLFDDSSSYCSSDFSGGSGNSGRYWWEQVTWTDDTDFITYRCPSLGPRHMRGFEMFTIGDCQSILLKLTNERCAELRGELNYATARQIEAEELMKEEDTDDDHGMMTDAEMTYLTSMEEVKTISRKLVNAEKSFTLVRNRIEKLINKYESLLIKIENESSCAASSVITYESSCYSEGAYSDYSLQEDREKQKWARRAQRAEVRAELAAREAIIARKEENNIPVDKQQELEHLHDRLTELQSEPSNVSANERQHSVVLAKAIAAKQRYDAQNRINRSNIMDPATTANTTSRSNHTNNNTDTKSKIDGVKQRFRDRMAAKMRNASTTTSSSGGMITSIGSHHNANSSLNHHHHAAPMTQYENNARSYYNRNRMMSNHYHQQHQQHQYQYQQHRMFGSTGEEMFQHLDFYERSLKAVDNSLS